MTSLPPSGWYPDPQNAGRSWRWWDGRAWAAPGPPYGPSRATHTRELSGRYGRWLRYAMVGNAATTLFGYATIGFLVSDLHDRWLNTSSNGALHVSGSFVVLQLLTMPLSLVGLAFVALLIAWTYQAGEFAGAMGWPSTRSRALGAFSILIPIVGLWWPYEAIRDAYPPGADHGVVLRWWLSYLIVPFATGIIILVTALVGTTTTLWIMLVIAVVPLSVPVAFGWKLIDHLDRAQRAAHVSARGAPRVRSLGA